MNKIYTLMDEAQKMELIGEKYQEIQKLYPQVGIALARGVLISTIASILKPT